MIRTFLARGDPGEDAMIREGLESVTCSNPPPAAQIATLGMKTYCSACKREGFVSPRGPRWPGTGPNGKQWALSGDINICGCNPPPVFYPARERNMTMHFTREQAAELMGSTGARATANAQTIAYNQRFHITNPRTGQPLRDMPYRIGTDDGDELEGRTDAQGFTECITSDQSISATLHVYEEETPLDPYWDR